MLFTNESETQILPEPLCLLDSRQLASLRNTFTDPYPTGIGFKQCSLLKLWKLFGRSEQRCTRPSAEIEQAGNCHVRRTQLDFRKNARDSRIGGGQSHR